MEKNRIFMHNDKMDEDVCNFTFYFRLILLYKILFITISYNAI